MESETPIAIETVPSKNGGLNNLMDDLSKSAPELDEKQRLEGWVKSQEQQQTLKVFAIDASGVKTALTSPDNEEIVVKRFDKGAAEAGFNSEKEDYAILEPHLGERFLPNTQFVEVRDAVDSNNKYYVLQDKMEGAHYKTATYEAQERQAAARTAEEIEQEYAAHPENWTKFRGEVLKEKLTTEQWEKAQQEARELYGKIKDLEKTHRLSDLDFFVTGEGEIKIIDCQVEDIASYKPDPEGYPEGSEEIKFVFNL